MASYILNPDADPESTSVDGGVARGLGAAGESWATIRAGAGNVSGDSTVKFSCGWGFTGGIYTDKVVSMARLILLFDGAAIPTNAKILSAVLTVNGTTGSVKDISYECTVNVYSSTPASNTELVNADYQELGDTAFSTDITYTNWDRAGLNDFALNAAGMAALQTAVSGSKIIKLGLRESTYEATGITPVWESGKRVLFNIDTADTTGNDPPKLVITVGALTRVTGIIHTFNPKNPDYRKRYSLLCVLGGISVFTSVPPPGVRPGPGDAPPRPLPIGPPPGFLPWLPRPLPGGGFPPPFPRVPEEPLPGDEPPEPFPGPRLPRPPSIPIVPPITPKPPPGLPDPGGPDLPPLPGLRL